MDVMREIRAAAAAAAAAAADLILTPVLHPPPLATAASHYTKCQVQPELVSRYVSCRPDDATLSGPWPGSLCALPCSYHTVLYIRSVFDVGVCI